MAKHTIDPVMLEQRAASFSRRSIKTDAKRQGLRLALSMLDLTTLEGKDSPEKVRALCRRAIQPFAGTIDPPLPSVAAICVYPALVPVARRALAGSNVRVASVATAFPSGQFPIELRVADVRAAVEAGADEIDMVVNRGALLAGRLGEVADEIRLIKEACGSAHLKIILETGELGSYDMIRRTSDLAINAASSVPGAAPLTHGEVFVKTSTGKIAPAATLASTLVLLESVRDHHDATGIRLGIKPAGGIRTAKQALHYLVMLKETLGDDWLTPSLFRFGASSLLDDLLRQLLFHSTGRYPAHHDFARA